MKFHEKIIGIIEDREDLTPSSVALKIGVSKQYMSKFKKRGAIGFPQLLKLSHVLNVEGETAAKTMSNWCLELDTTEAIKQSFEYACLTRNTTLLEKLIIKHSKETGTLREYVEVYTILFKYIKDIIKGSEITSQLKEIGCTKDKVLEILKRIMECYEYYHLKKFNLMMETAEMIELQVQQIEGERKAFIKECYTYRIAELFAPIFLQRNNVDIARKYADFLINANVCTKTVSDAYYILGMSYILENKEQCLVNLQKSYLLSKNTGDIDIEREARYNLDAAKLYFGVTLSEDADSRLLLYQKKPKDELSINALQDIIRGRGDKDFLNYFIACSTNNIEALYELFYRYFHQANYLFSAMVAKELCNRGDESLLTQSMVNFGNEKQKGVVDIEKNNISSLYTINGINSGIVL
ncbi:AimR family lysis-lysogeny pheromone receptor [Bacillus thuringiensis]|uniref:AimR family lysis-lysogeny pheromone receptor n=1 Tax=Bacillus thuringiensis TaxID=1428 RepID=UPI0011A45721|nr:AimR family lysis-lysogeny pheromone receptor [Bacillus thuringiensis]